MSPRASSRSTSTSRAVSPAGGSAGGRARSPTACQHRVDRLTAELAGVRLLAQLPRRVARGADGAMGARLGHRAPHVGCSEHPRDRRQLLGAHAAVIARAIEAFVVRGGGAGELAQRRDPGEQPLGVVAVKPYLLPFAARQRSWLLPDRGRDADAPHVVQPCRPSQLADRLGRQPEPPACGLGNLRHRARMPEGAVGLQVGVVGDHLARLIEILTREQSRPRLRRHHPLPSIDSTDALQQRRRVLAEQSSEARVETRPGRALGHRTDHLRAARSGERGCVTGGVQDPRRDRYPLTGRAGRHPLSVPALEHEPQPLARAFGQPQPLPEPFADLTVAAEIDAREPGARGQRADERTQTLGRRRRRIHVAPEIGDDLGRPPGIDQRVRRLVRPVVAERPRGHRRVRGAADRVQQPEVVGVLELLRVEAGELRELERQQARTQPVLSDLAGTQIRRQRQRREQLARTYGRAARGPARRGCARSRHAPVLHRRGQRRLTDGRGARAGARIGRSNRAAELALTIQIVGPTRRLITRTAGALTIQFVANQQPDDLRNQQRGVRRRPRVVRLAHHPGNAAVRSPGRRLMPCVA